MATKKEITKKAAREYGVGGHTAEGHGIDVTVDRVHDGMYPPRWHVDDDVGVSVIWRRDEPASHGPCAEGH